LADALGYPRHLFHLAIMSDKDLQTAVRNSNIEFISQKLIEMNTLEEPELSNSRFKLQNCIFKGVEVKAGLIAQKIDDLQVD
jgi:hypothetical protein